MDIKNLGPWLPLLKAETDKEYFKTLSENVDGARLSGEVYPPAGLMFSAFSATPPEKVKAVILGQDPYHEPGQAMGLAFSVPDGVPLPPSLKNIFKELGSDMGASPPSSGNLTKWAKQGVFLLNTVLTVERGRANSHAKFGWQKFTDAVITATAGLSQPIAYILWGTQAWKKASLIENRAYPTLIIRDVHPSPLSAYRGFFGSRPFSRVNDFLASNGCGVIDW